MFNLKKKSKSKGFTLIEILLVVGFIALAGIGVYVVYNKVQTSNAANTEVRNLDTIRAGIKNIYAGSTNYTGINAEVLHQAKVTPDNMALTGNGTESRLKNSYGGNVDAYATTFNGSNAFAIRYSGMPADMCTKFVTIGGNSFNRVMINDISVKNTSVVATEKLNIAETANLCSQGDALIIMTSL